MAQELKHTYKEKLEAMGTIERSRVAEIALFNKIWLAGVLSRTQLRLSLKQYLDTQDPKSLAKMERILTDASGSYPGVFNMVVLGLEGETLLNLNEGSRQVNLLEGSLFDEGMKGGSIHLGVDPKNLRDLYFSGPLILDGKTLGVLIVGTNRNPFLDFAQDVKGLGGTGEVLLLEKDFAGEVSSLSPSRFLPFWEGQAKDDLKTYVKGLRAGVTISSSDYRGKGVYSYFADIPGENWMLVVKVDKDEVYSALPSLLFSFLIEAVVVLIGLLLFLLFCSKYIVGPLDQLKNELRKVQQSKDLHRRVSVPTQIEMKRLAEAFNDLLSDLEQNTVSVGQLKKEVEHRKKAEEEAVRASKVKSDFLSVISHEIRTPLTAIMGSAFLVSKHLGDLPQGSPKIEQNLKTIDEAGYSLLMTIDNILDLVRYRSGTMDLKNETVDLAALIQEVSMPLQTRAATSRQEIQVNLDSRLGLQFKSDPEKLKRVLSNLLDNAIKFSRKGQVIFLDVFPDREGICLQVKDQGLGIEIAKQKLIFNAFHQLSEGLTRDFGGTGLGLSLVQFIVQHIGGEIRLESQPTKGTTVSIYWPMAQA